MKIWPSDSFNIETALSPEEIVAKIGSTISPVWPFRWSPNHAKFFGSLSTDGFTIERVIRYRNPTLPIVTGRFIPGTSGTKVAIHIGLHWFTIAFALIPFCGIILPMLYYTACLLIRMDRAVIEMSVAVGIVIIGWWIFFFGLFWFEAKKQKSMLIKMFQDTMNAESNIR